MNLLHTLGLMTRKEHEAAAEANERQAVRIRSLEGDVRRMTVGRDDWRSAAKDWQSKHASVVSKLDRAATDLAAQADEIAELREANAFLARGNALLLRENFALRPDALAMRRKRQMDRDRAAGKRGEGA